MGKQQAEVNANSLPSLIQQHVVFLFLRMCSHGYDFIWGHRIEPHFLSQTFLEANVLRVHDVLRRV